ncbi:hypothetical protein [Endozoicomonas euniceicola]
MVKRTSIPIMGSFMVGMPHLILFM